jgi:thioredoxin 1
VGVRLGRVALAGLVSLALAASLLGGCSKEAEDGGAASQRRSPPVRAQKAASDSAEGMHHPGPGRTASGSVAKPVPGLPRLVDLGRNTCIPCKMMAPILEEIKREFEGTVVVEIVDLREDEGAAAEYGIRLIPTQIFFDARGEEVWRHEGFLPKAAIVDKFTEMGVPTRDR